MSNSVMCIDRLRHLYTCLPNVVSTSLTKPQTSAYIWLLTPNLISATCQIVIALVRLLTIKKKQTSEIRFITDLVGFDDTVFKRIIAYYVIKIIVFLQHKITIKPDHHKTVSSTLRASLVLVYSNVVNGKYLIFNTHTVSHFSTTFARWSL